jgi:hypothetical protein
MTKRAVREWEVAARRSLTVNGRTLKPGTPVQFSEKDTAALASRGRIVRRAAAQEPAGEE